MKRLLAASAFASFSFACTSPRVDLGSQADSSADSNSSGADGAESSPLSGTYSGYVESFMFPDGSDNLVMALTFAADGTVTGTVLFGDAPLLSPPTDPNVGYPPGFSDQVMVGVGAPSEGFYFTVLDGTYTSSRLRLEIAPPEIWKQWCQIQTTIYPQYGATSDGSCGPLDGYGCLPNAATVIGPSGCTLSSCQEPTPMPVDCGKLTLCGSPSPCVCTATSCTADLGPNWRVAFDMVLAAGMLDGSSTGLGSTPFNVHLTRP